jgi:photosynthesis system II assembly factor YCF48-like protein
MIVDVCRNAEFSQPYRLIILHVLRIGQDLARPGNPTRARAVIGVMRKQLLRAARPAAGLGAGVALVLASGCGSAPHAGHSTPTPGRHVSGSSSPTPSPTPTPRQSCATSSGPAANPGGNAKLALNAVQFVSASAGWVVGSDRIMHTADGGQRWVIQYQTSANAGLATIDFIDASHGWVVGAATVLATTDGGTHWHALPEPCEPIRAVHFFSPSDGVAVAGGGALIPGSPSGGGNLLSTTDGGEHWRHLSAPHDVQTACFTNVSHGWLGASGNIYGTTDGGRNWTLAVNGPTSAVAEVECAGPRAAWAQLVGPGVGMSHEQQIGYHTYGTSWRPIFAEQYFPHPGMRVRAEAPGVYAGPFSAISPAQAVFIGSCSPCSNPATPQLQGTAPMDIATSGGAVLTRRGVVAQLEQANGAAFVTADDGWVVGTQTRYPANGPSRGRTVSRIMHTADGGRTWQVQYVLGR